MDSGNNIPQVWNAYGMPDAVLSPSYALVYFLINYIFNKDVSTKKANSIVEIGFDLLSKNIIVLLEFENKMLYNL